MSPSDRAAGTTLLWRFQDWLQSGRFWRLGNLVADLRYYGWKIKRGN